MDGSDVRLKLGDTDGKAFSGKAASRVLVPMLAKSFLNSSAVALVRASTMDSKTKKKTFFGTKFKEKNICN